MEAPVSQREPMSNEQKFLTDEEIKLTAQERRALAGRKPLGSEQRYLIARDRDGRWHLRRTLCVTHHGDTGEVTYDAEPISSHRDIVGALATLEVCDVDDVLQGLRAPKQEKKMTSAPYAQEQDDHCGDAP